ncbi:uncharacterized protein LOC142333296 isoform X2 [Lycorma delicatula]|uniref:uncharacterized protein LOC142333296 isoform X2 n=1 Tax=Lycorma delicatula TaxID=130591 RepID=UPI003F516FDE
MDSSATESPLDVLSRAATMVQDNTFNTLPPSYDEARSYLKCKELAATGIGNAATGGKWNSKREQRRIRTATGGSVVATAALPGHNAATTSIITATTTTHNNNNNNNNNNLVHHPEPIDMSITKKIRGSPPSYQQSVQFIHAAAANAAGRPHRPSVITSCPGTVNSNNSTNDVSDGGGVCDSVVDEHFRRSLGKDYLSVFSSNNNRSNSRINGSEEDIISSDIGSALSVDDHFAKALGDTWLKLQQRNTEEKNKKNESDTTSSTTAEQVQDVSTSDTEVSSNRIATKTQQKTIQKSLIRHDRRLL